MSKAAVGPTKHPMELMLEIVSKGLKWCGCQVDHPTPSTAEVANQCSYMSASLAWCGQG